MYCIVTYVYVKNMRYLILHNVIKKLFFYEKIKKAPNIKKYCNTKKIKIILNKKFLKSIFFTKIMTSTNCINYKNGYFYSN